MSREEKEAEIWSRGKAISFIVFGLLVVAWGHYAVGMAVNAPPVCEKVIVRTVGANGTVIGEAVVKDPTIGECTISTFGFMLMVSAIVTSIGVFVYGLDKL